MEKKNKQCFVPSLWKKSNGKQRSGNERAHAQNDAAFLHNHDEHLGTTKALTPVKELLINCLVSGTTGWSKTCTLSARKCNKSDSDTRRPNIHSMSQSGTVPHGVTRHHEICCNICLLLNVCDRQNIPKTVQLSTEHVIFCFS